jgi:hypothetical protein
LSCEATAASICKFDIVDGSGSPPILSRGKNLSAPLQDDPSIPKFSPSSSDSIEGYIETSQHRRRQSSLKQQHFKSRYQDWPNGSVSEKPTSEHLEEAWSGRIDRQPCDSFCISTSVCFESNRQPGTRKWLEVVTEFVDNTDEFDDWDDSIPTKVKSRLAQEGITHFLVFLTHDDHQPCTDITEGSWFDATDEEFFQYTKQQFFNTFHVD